MATTLRPDGLEEPERGAHPRKGRSGCASPSRERKRGCSDPSLIVPLLPLQSHDQPRSFLANALRAPNKTGCLELLVVPRNRPNGVRRPAACKPSRARLEELGAGLWGEV